jgi:superfamily I DNA/RNA helicase
VIWTPDLADSPRPSPSQRRAIEAEPGPLLVLAGPGAGKTFCLIERIRFLVQRWRIEPARICAFTFTNKAAGEIEERLAGALGDSAHLVRGGTIHAFCAKLLREHGKTIGLAPGFGIADEEYQINVLRRIEGPRPRHYHTSALTRFSAHRFRNKALKHEDVMLLDQYDRFMAKRNVLDFDSLVLMAADLLETEAAAAEIRDQWQVILVDEFQDLNPVQYRIVRALARDHGHVFAVGDDEQSIFSWAGADPRLFNAFRTDFAVEPVHLEENRRCPRDVVALARRLVMVNTPILAQRESQRAERDAQFEIRAHRFADEDQEAEWLVADLCAEAREHSLRWGDFALLYRRHEIGERLESALLNAGVACRMATGRALSDDPVVAYVLATALVVTQRGDDVARDAFLRAVLPGTLCDEAEALTGSGLTTLSRRLARLAANLPRADDRARRIRRARADLENLLALSREHTSLGPFVQDLLSRRVGRLTSWLEERHDEISDPADNLEVTALAERLRAARTHRRTVWLAPMGGVDIPLKAMLQELGLQVRRGDAVPAGSEIITDTDVPSLGIALGVFKAAQLMEMADLPATFRDYTAVDLETTGQDTRTAEIIEIAASRVRDGQVVDTFSALVKPVRPIPPASTLVHGITDADVASAPAMAAIWPGFREFCGSDVLIAHNGYDFDFPILRRVARELGDTFDLTQYDSLPLARQLCPTSRKLEDLARQFGVLQDNAHRALDDTRALAAVMPELENLKLSRARKIALVGLLDHLGVALAIETLKRGERLHEEARLFRDLAIPFTLGRYSNCLEFYEQERAGDESLPSREEVASALAGPRRIEAIQRERTADQRYPAAMRRLRRIIGAIPDGPLDEQLGLFLERIALSRFDGDDTDHDRVNLLTLHSTKGLEFSRVYVVGAEDSQFFRAQPGAAPDNEDLEEGRRLLYVGMTRTIDRLTLTCVATRSGKPTGGHRFLDEMELSVAAPALAEVE